MRTESLPPLAILGGKPAFAEPLHVGAPNICDREAFFKRMNDVFDGGRLTNRGPCVREFETEIAARSSARHAVAMTNGTVALEIGARALGLSGEVIVPAFTFVATPHALRWQGIEPVFCDVDPLTHNIDPADVERRITPRTTGILAVHLWGRPAPHAELKDIAKRYGLRLMYDAAHAFGCEYEGQGIGGLGDLSIFSFHATKVLGTGEGGAIVTNDDDIAERVRLMQNFGFTGLDTVVALGINGKMNEMSAAMGLTGLDQVDGWIRINRSHRELYREALAPVPGISLLDETTTDARNHQYVIVEVDAAETGIHRDAIVKILRAENVLARRYFYPGCHRMEPYRSSPPSGGWSLPSTQRVADRIMVLPTGPQMVPADIQTIGRILAEAVGQGPALSDRMIRMVGGEQ